MPIEIVDEYGYVVLSMATIGLVQFFIGASVMGKRKEAFSSTTFLENPEVKKLQDTHKKLYGDAIDKLGYPDMGSGLYSHLLEYEAWVDFNNTQRAHYNMVEQTGPLVATIAGAGLWYPRLVATAGISYALGRWLYAQGYRAQGAKGRKFGAILSALSQLTVYGIAVYIAFQHTNLVSEVSAWVGRQLLGCGRR
eukprot:gene3250-3561_t